MQGRPDGAADNLAQSVRRIPPPGVGIAQAEREALLAGANSLSNTIVSLRAELKAKPEALRWLPDIEVLHKAVFWALAYDEFYKVEEAAIARSFLALGSKRADALREGQVPWLNETGLVVRGYRSKIDDSIQPFGLVVPPSYRPGQAHKFRLDCWFHGRGEQLSELAFIQDRLKNRGEFAPPDTIVLHPYGRYCNANKFAGEVDLFEAMDVVRRDYAVDENRIAVRGFSMGGAACWQFAVHYPGLWAAAAPGAGFAETPDFLRVFQSETVAPTEYEKQLWHLYDCTDYAVNLYNCPTVAYSGEKDRQKQAADRMAEAMSQEGMRLTHVIGPGVEHRYQPDAKREVERIVDGIVAVGRDLMPRRVKFTTWTLRYDRCAWVRVEAMENHWQRASIDAEVLDGDRQGAGDGGGGRVGTRARVRVATSGCAAFALEMAPGRSVLDGASRPVIEVDGQRITGPIPGSDRSWAVRLAKTKKDKDGWSLVEGVEEVGGLRKRHGLQGPVDDAFMDRFVFVVPTGKPLNAAVGAWVSSELAHAVDHWRRQFRGDVRVVEDGALTEADIEGANLILWGDPSSNLILGKIASRLPLRWDAAGVHTGAKVYPADRYVPVSIQPNPLNPRRYVVLNSGFTFREYDYLNNARQVPKIPDYAVLDLTQAADARHAAGIVEAGFFDERWELPPGRP